VKEVSSSHYLWLIFESFVADLRDAFENNFDDSVKKKTGKDSN